MHNPTSGSTDPGGAPGLLIVSILTFVLAIPGFAQRIGKAPADGYATTTILQSYGAYLTSRNEVVSLRSPNARHYDIDGHTRMAVLSVNPMFYTGPGGELEEISNRIIPDGERAGEGFAYRNEANDVLIYFSTDGARCSIVDGNGDPLAMVSSAYASGAGTVAASGNRLVKSFDEDSSDFAWTVEGSAVSYRYFVNRKIATENPEPGVRIDWQQPVVERDRFGDERRTTSMSSSTVVAGAGEGVEVRFGEMVSRTETTTTVSGYVTLYAAQTGTVYKSSPSATPVAAGSGIRLQNLSDPGCSYGYRGWAKFDLSAFHAGDTIYALDLYVYMTAVHDGLFDYVDMNVSRLAEDPVSSPAPVTWGGIQTGTAYVYDLGFYSTGWHLIPLPGSDGDFEGAIASPGWFGLGFMVWCDENNSDFLINISGVGGSTPYLRILYSPIDDVVGDADDAETPLRFELQQNYPNPFNPKTTIRYVVAEGGPVRLSVFNVLGQEVAVLVDEVQGPGERTVSFDAGNLPSGVYAYRLTAGTSTDVKKLMLVR